MHRLFAGQIAIACQCHVDVFGIEFYGVAAPTGSFRRNDGRTRTGEAIEHNVTALRAIEDRTLDVHEALVEARYGHGRLAALERANLDLEKLRLLLRLATTRNALPRKTAAHAFEQIDEAGRMVGGWLKHTRQRP